MVSREGGGGGGGYHLYGKLISQPNKDKTPAVKTQQPEFCCNRHRQLDANNAMENQNQHFAIENAQFQLEHRQMLQRIDRLETIAMLANIPANRERVV